MGAVLTAEILTNGQLKLTTTNLLGQTVQLSLGEKIKSENALNWEVVVGLNAVFKVTNHHFTDLYTVSTTNGTVSITDGVITYTPSTIGQGGFTINGQKVNVTVVQDKVGKPNVTLPKHLSTGVSRYVEAASSDFKVQNTAITHAYSRWQVASDASFTQIIYDGADASNLTRLKLPKLKNGQKYYVRIQHFGKKP
jgi:hypothetical protein